MEMIRFVLGSLFILCGLVIFIIEIFGLVGTMFYFGWSLACLKLLFVEIFLWLSSPVSSHLVAKLEAETNEDLGKEVKIREIKEDDPCKY